MAPTEVEITVIANILMEPNLVYLLPCSQLHYQVKAIRFGRPEGLSFLNAVSQMLNDLFQLAFTSVFRHHTAILPQRVDVDHFENKNE